VSEYLNTEELVAAYPALFSVSMLKKSRMKYADASGPPHFKLGRKVVYARSDVDAWLSEMKVGQRRLAVVAPPVNIRRGRPSKAQEIARRQRAA
jgi:hypothetical protein